MPIPMVTQKLAKYETVGAGAMVPQGWGGGVGQGKEELRRMEGWGREKEGKNIILTLVTLMVNNTTLPIEKITLL